MFHALLYPLSCVLFQLWSTFHMISWTNLLTRATVPAACFCCFWFQESQKMNILGIGRDKSQSAYFYRSHQVPEYETERVQGATTPPGRAARPDPRQGVVWPLPAPRRPPLRL